MASTPEDAGRAHTKRTKGIKSPRAPKSSSGRSRAALLETTDKKPKSPSKSKSPFSRPSDRPLLTEDGPTPLAEDHIAGGSPLRRRLRRKRSFTDPPNDTIDHAEDLSQTGEEAPSDIGADTKSSPPDASQVRGRKRSSSALTSSQTKQQHQQQQQQQQKHQTSSDIEDIPNELVVAVIEFLPTLRDVASMASTCLHFSSLIQEHDIIWRNMLRKCLPADPWMDLFQHLASNCGISWQMLVKSCHGTVWMPQYALSPEDGESIDDDPCAIDNNDSNHNNGNNTPRQTPRGSNSNNNGNTTPRQTPRGSSSSSSNNNSGSDGARGKKEANDAPIGMRHLKKWHQRFKGNSGLPNSAPLDTQYDMVLCGSGGVGAKTALIQRFVKDTFINRYDPTIVDTYCHQFSVDGESVIGNFVDTAGQEEFCTLRDEYIKSGEGLLIGYSVTSLTSLAYAAKLRGQIARIKQVDDLSTVPIVLVGNKMDLTDQREVTTEQGADLAKEWGVPFFETSAKTGENVRECLVGLIREIRRKRQYQAHTTLVNRYGGEYIGSTVFGIPDGTGTVVFSPEENSVLSMYRGGWYQGRRHGAGTLLLRGHLHRSYLRSKAATDTDERRRRPNKGKAKAKGKGKETRKTKKREEGTTGTNSSSSVDKDELDAERGGTSSCSSDSQDDADAATAPRRKKTTGNTTNKRKQTTAMAGNKPADKPTTGKKKSPAPNTSSRPAKKKPPSTGTLQGVWHHGKLISSQPVS
eukprot:TRINITY_DN2958_c0_g1_i1.p1 TRINITY_DN2958_c0_g1~~TRINITY_DN2958_c0_g1_i1.p1  ORF type:complete len:747 (+),score=147.85 TRINITY_DN2958_c0_g1_i1:89-2329(+)